ncbi:MAG TPA: DUF190 domain-containing protein [Beijerinckiaceae bacterium]|nr:DUF190 domain-containing protein [Beijerinckiaceae bacterium]
MQTHKKKRIELVVEGPVLNRTLDLLDRAGVGGYTVLPALAGRGRRGKWTSQGFLGEIGRMVMITSIVDESRIGPLLREINDLIVEKHIGIVSVLDAEVIRADRF